MHPQFLEMLVSRLSSADHALCANSLQLINSLMRDAITNDVDGEWPRFIKRLQDLGVIKAVFVRFTLLWTEGSICEINWLTIWTADSYAKFSIAGSCAPIVGIPSID